MNAGSPRPWWQTVPGALSVLAALITIVGGLLALYQQGLLPGSRPDTELEGQHVFRSADGNYEAKRVGSGSNVHYQIRETRTGRVALTTTAEFSTPNDVKAGMFSPDSKLFAAVYHYGHAGGYTWVGVWSLDTGMRVRFETKPGWTMDASFVFARGPG